MSEGMLYGWVCVRSGVGERWLGLPLVLALWGAVGGGGGGVLGSGWGGGGDTGRWRLVLG